MKITKAVIPAAGLGTRFLPVTKAVPKEMLPLIDRPIIQYIVEECVAAGITDIVLVTARGKEALEHYFDRAPALESVLQEKNQLAMLETVRSLSQIANIITVRQKEPLGLGHAVWTAKSVIGDEPFAVLLGDDIVVGKKPATRQLMEIAQERQTSVIGVMNVARTEVSKYGIVGGTMLSDRLMAVSEMVEKPSPQKAPSTLACPGRYVLTPTVFKKLENLSPGTIGEIQLTDALAGLARGEGLFAYLFDGQRFDAGDKLGYIEATLAFALERPELRDGVRNLIRRFHQ